MSRIQVTFQLTGANAGRTMTLRKKYPFVDGRMTLTDTPEQMALHAKALEVNWSAYAVGDPRLNQEPANEQREVPPAAKLDGDQGVQGGGLAAGGGAPAGEPGEAGQGAAEANAGGPDVPAGGDGHPASLNSLLGSSVLPSTLELTGQETMTLGDLVGRSFKDSGLTADEWNALDPEAREVRLAATWNTMKAEAVAAAVAKDPKPFVNTKLAAAIAQLDPKDDSHWTGDGKPAMKAVETFYGASDITRADVSAAAPGLTRATATKQE